MSAWAVATNRVRLPSKVFDGLTYSAQNRFADGERLFKNSLDRLEKSMGPDVPALAPVLFVPPPQSRGASRHARNPRAETAQTDETVAAEANTEIVSMSAWAVATNRVRLRSKVFDGLTYSAQNRFADGEPLFKNSLDRLEKSMGPDVPALAPVLFVPPRNRVGEAATLEARARKAAQNAETVAVEVKN